jgi:hypothetical protein
MIKIITPNDEYHYFFAYYDMRATGDGINQNHLTHRVKFMDRLQTENDVCEVGYLKNNKFYKIGETTAWNFQQGALLQWYDEENIIYNHRDEKGFCSIIKNISTKAERRISMPIANLSNDRKWGLSVNFGRIYA